MEIRTALLHYWLTGMRGGEMVLEQFCRMFPNADIYTHVIDKTKISDVICRHPVHTSFIAGLPFAKRRCQSYLPLMPSASKKWDLSPYQMIISSESGPVKGIRKPEDCYHICYCHTPMRYVWDMYDEYYRNAGLCGKAAMKIFHRYLRKCDLESAETVNQFVANSKFVAERIHRIYARDAAVIYPPADVHFFHREPPRERTFYLYAGQLVCYKHPELAVKAFSKLQNETLVVAGKGPMLPELRKTASKNIRFISDVSKEELRTLYSSAKALIFPGIEDFGIIPVEAQAAGCPVIAMNLGGTAETVKNHETGVFMKEQTVSAIPESLETAKSIHWNRDILFQNAKRFSYERFDAEFRALLKQCVPFYHI